MKPLLRFFTILFLFFIGISCSTNDDPSDVIITFNANLTPVTGTGSEAYGDAVLKLNKTAKTFKITVTYYGLTATHGHIHALSDGAIIFPFPDSPPLASPIVLTFNISSAQITELMANHYYINLHTDAFPNGEISGTLIKGAITGGGGGGGY